MSQRWTRPLTCLATLGLCLTACSTEAWYEGMKTRARNECYQRAPGDQQNCLDKVNKQSYDQYEKERTQGRAVSSP